MNIFGSQDESSELPLFLMGKFILMCTCFGLQVFPGVLPSYQGCTVCPDIVLVDDIVPLFLMI